MRERPLGKGVRGKALVHQRQRPYEARVRCELGRLIGDGALVAAGLRMLREIGDVDQLDRYA